MTYIGSVGDIGAFGQWLQSSGLSKASRDCYLSRVKQFMRYAEREGVDDGETSSQSLSEVIASYVAHCMSERNFSDSSVNAALCALDQYCLFRNVSKPDLPRLASQSEIRVLNMQEQRRLLVALDRQGSPKAKAIVALFFLSGCRAGEVRYLELAAVHFTPEGGEIKLRDDRRIELSEQVAAIVYHWLQRRGIMDRTTTESKLMFPGQSGEAMSLAGIDALVRNLARFAGLNVSARELRDTYIVNQFERGLGLFEVAALAGVNRPRVLRRYIPLVDTLSGGDAVDIGVSVPAEHSGLPILQAPGGKDKVFVETRDLVQNG